MALQGVGISPGLSECLAGFVTPSLRFCACNAFFAPLGKKLVQSPLGSLCTRFRDPVLLLDLDQPGAQLVPLPGQLRIFGSQFLAARLRCRYLDLGISFGLGLGAASRCAFLFEFLGQLLPERTRGSAFGLGFLFQNLLMRSDDGHQSRLHRFRDRQVIEP